MVRIFKLHKITVIVPTTAELHRKEGLLNAIESIISQEAVRAIPLVVINGNKFDKSLKQYLFSRTDIFCFYLDEGNVTSARFFAVQNVDTDFYAFLDDDDIYLKSSLITRLRPMLSNKEIGLTVANGYRKGLADRVLLRFDEKLFNTNPLAALLTLPWLCSCSGLFRKSLVDETMFRPKYEYQEWTYMAFILSQKTRISFINKPTFLINRTPGSLSSSPKMETCRARLMEEIATSGISKELSRKFIVKKYAALHMASALYIKNKSPRLAWKYHLLCLLSFNGIKYITFTYHLCVYSLFKKFT